MKRHDDIDFSKLLGFDAVNDQISGSVDFQDETIGAKLGAKVGIEPRMPPANAEACVATR